MLLTWHAISFTPNQEILTVTLAHTHTRNAIVLLLFLNLSGTTQVSRYQKGKNQECKTKLDLLEQEIVSGSGTHTILMLNIN